MKSGSYDRLKLPLLNVVNSQSCCYEKKILGQLDRNDYFNKKGMHTYIYIVVSWPYHDCHT